MAETKTCTKCGKPQPMDCFHRDKNRRDGKNPWCKGCMKVALADWAARNTDYGERRYAQNTDREKAHSKQWREANPEKTREMQQRSRAKNPEAHRAARRRFRERHPEKARAHAKVNNAIYRGKLVKPSDCESCGAETESHRLHAHHEDYSKPFEVEWLCFPCHRALHDAEETSGRESSRKRRPGL